MTTLVAEPRTPLVARLRNPAARRWYFGSLFGLLYQVIEIGAVVTSDGTVGQKVVAVAALLVVYAIYLALPPLLWPETQRVRLAALVGYWALTCLLFPLVGETAVWVWTLIAASVGFALVDRLSGGLLIVALAAAQILIAWSLGWPDSITVAPFITFSVGIAMLAFAQQIRQTQLLRAANAEIARLAVGEERARFARDLHDSLGHSLTVVAVKAELAGRLVGLDPERAVAEMADAESMARGALADLRAAVAGYRDVTLDTELAAAATALEAAGVAAALPEDSSVVAPELRPLFGWAVREGVTNILRHANATACSIELGRSTLRILDDGAGATGPSDGHGLRGLAERAAPLGARVTAGRVEGGFELAVLR